MIYNFLGCHRHDGTEPPLKKDLPSASSPCLPDELIVHILDYLASPSLNGSFSKEAIKPLLCAAQVCSQWHRVAQDYLPKIFKSCMEGIEKPASLSWLQALHLIHKWKEQTFSFTSDIFLGLFEDPKHCGVLSAGIPYVLDRTQIGELRISLLPRLLLACQGTDKKFTQIWKIDLQGDPFKRIFVSTDQHLIATLHQGNDSDRKHRFDIYVVKTGRLLGSVALHCLQNEFFLFNHSNLRFDLTKFEYLHKGKIWSYRV